MKLSLSLGRKFILIRSNYRQETESSFFYFTLSMKSFYLLTNEMALKVQFISDSLYGRKKIILCVSQIDYSSKWPSFGRNLYRTGSCGEKLNWMNQLLSYFLCQSDKLLRAFLEHISFRLKPLTLLQQAANFISSVLRVKFKILTLLMR